MSLFLIVRLPPPLSLSGAEACWPSGSNSIPLWQHGRPISAPKRTLPHRRSRRRGHGRPHFRRDHCRILSDAEAPAAEARLGCGRCGGAGREPDKPGKTASDAHDRGSPEGRG
ncbi:hypothetical protein C8R47DRAFT_1198185 [Mycena vitilis]|nr:hypothetical protein C8R47DRAFT_1198185 [Mycena vitilis]